MSLISKQVDDLRDYAKSRRGELARIINGAADTIESLSEKLSARNMECSSAYYHGGWIPCSERMPENNDEVLVTYTVNGKKHRYVETATWYDGDEGYWSSPWDEYRVPGTKTEVIAWMPLPTPYRPEGEEHERAYL